MTCRPACAACCIVPSISSPLPALPAGKPAFTRCPHLSPSNLCLLFNQPARPAVCRSLQPSPDMCGETDKAAFARLAQLERATRP